MKYFEIVSRKNLNPIKINVPGDPSSAAFFTALTLMNKNSKLVIHRHKSSDQFVYPNGLELYREKNYGQSRITILKKWKF